MSEKNEYEITPSYISAGVFERFLDLARKKAWPVINSSLLQDNGFSKAQSFPLISALKFLGLTDDEGNSTPDMIAITAAITEQQLQAILKKIIEKSYGKLLEDVVLPEADIDQLDQYFRRRNIAPTVATRSARFFIWLANRAGMEIGDTVATYKRQADIPKKGKEKPKLSEKGKLDPLVDIDLTSAQSADEYEKALLDILLTKAKESTTIPDFETVKQIREIISSIEEKERRHADGPKTVQANKQENEEDA